MWAYHCVESSIGPRRSGQQRYTFRAAPIFVSISRLAIGAERMPGRSRDCTCAKLYDGDGTGHTNP